MDLNKLSMPEKIISASAIVLLIASFLPWFTASIEGFGSDSINGWSSDVGFLWGVLPLLLGLVMLAHVVLTNFADNVKLPDWPWPMIHMIAGIAAGALIILKLLIGIDDGGASAFGVEISRGIGIYLAALAGIGLAAGGFLYNKDKSGSGAASM